MNEVQPGSYIFMDKDYNLNDHGGVNFKQSLYLLSSVCSINEENKFLVLDAGWKSTTMDSGEPVFKDFPENEFVWGGDEHSMMKNVKNICEFRLDDKIWLIPALQSKIDLTRYVT